MLRKLSTALVFHRYPAFCLLGFDHPANPQKVKAKADISGLATRLCLASCFIFHYFDSITHGLFVRQLENITQA
jgi:hypothetical protein